MKKHEKDLQEFCLLRNLTKLPQRLFAVLAFMGLSAMPLSAEVPCDPEAAFEISLNGNSIVFTALMPNQNALYSWTWSGVNGNSGTATGTSFTIPYNTAQDDYFTVQLNVIDDYGQYTCIRHVGWTQSCTRADFTVDKVDCYASFSPISPYIFGYSHYWTFGDGTSSNETQPTHLYNTGAFTVCHFFAQQLPSSNDISLNYCCKLVEMDCSGGGGGGGGNGAMLAGECCRLKVCFTHPIQDPNAAYFWNFGDGKTSTEMNPCHYYDNVSTYPVSMGGTPTVVVQRCITTAGGTQTCTNITIVLVSTAQPAAIYVGEPNVTTSLDVVSSIDGQPLFPGNEMVGPKEVHNIGELRIGKDFTFKNYVNFCMDPCSGMIVQHNRSLTFDNNITLANKCCLWRSIDLEYAANFASTNNNIISGAQYALRTKGTMTMLRISDTYFGDNWVGVFARHPLSLAKFDRNIFHANAIDPHCSSLSCDQEIQNMAQIPHLQRGFAGIVGKNTILNLPASGTAADNNVFRFMDNGIWLQNSDAEIRRCDFLHIIDEAYGQKSGNGIRFNVSSGSHSLKQWGNNTQFFGTSTGIRVQTASGSIDNSFIDSRNNNMEVFKYGYRLEIGGILALGSVIRDNAIKSLRIGIDATMINAENSNSHLDIASNNITIDDGTGNNGIGIFVNDAVPPVAASLFHDINVIENLVTLDKGRSAIEVNNFKGADVAFNVLQINETTGSGTPPYAPMGIYASGGKKNNFRCNTITGTTAGGPQHAFVNETSHDNIISGNTLKNTRVGFDFRGICGSMTDFTCNSMENHDVGMRYWLGAKTGDQFNKGNKWIGTAFGIAAWHMGTNGTYLNGCRFKAATGTNQWPPSIDAPNGLPLWFTSGNFVACNSGCDVMLQPDDTNDMDLAIATIGFDMPSNNGVYNWDAHRYLYDKLAASPNLSSQNATYSGFQSNQANTSVGLLQNSAAQTCNLFSAPPATKQALDANFSAMKAALSAISSIDASIAAGGLTASQVTNLLSDKETQTSILSYLQASTEQLQAQLLASRSIAANNVLAFNNGIAVNALHDQNEKTLLGIYLNTEAKNLPMTLTQKAQVLAIAEQCPESGGYVTYWARAWYAAETGKLVLPQGCISVGERNGEVVKEVEGHTPSIGQFQLAPNPAQDFVTIIFDPSFDWENASIVLRDANGLVRLSQKIERRAKEFVLSIQNLPNGVYWVSLKPDGRAISVQKLVILR